MIDVVPVRSPVATSMYQRIPAGRIPRVRRRDDWTCSVLFCWEEVLSQMMMTVNLQLGPHCSSQTVRPTDSIFDSRLSAGNNLLVRRVRQPRSYTVKRDVVSSIILGILFFLFSTFLSKPELN
jgi:hypothetical protein